LQTNTAQRVPLPQARSMLVFDSKALDLLQVLILRSGAQRESSLSTKQEDKAVDNNRFLNQIKSFDHWLFCVHCETNIAALEQMFVPPSMHHVRAHR
jgi:hypothetical protein